MTLLRVMRGIYDNTIIVIARHSFLVHPALCLLRAHADILVLCVRQDSLHAGWHRGGAGGVIMGRV